MVQHQAHLGGRGEYPKSLCSCRLKKRQAIRSRFGRRLQQLRESAGLSQMALAQAAELNRVFIGKIERGETSPTIDTIEKLSMALGLPPQGLLILDDEAGEHELVQRVRVLVKRLDARDLERLGKIVGAFFE